MGAPFIQPPRGRRVGADGLIDIKCRICEKTIVRQPYMGFSTAICAVCHGELEAGKKPEEIVAQTVQRERDEAAELYNDIGMGGFKVHGLKKRIQQIVEEVRQAATRRKRSPLFAKKDEVK